MLFAASIRIRFVSTILKFRHHQPVTVAEVWKLHVILGFYPNPIRLHHLIQLVTGPEQLVTGEATLGSVEFGSLETTCYSRLLSESDSSPPASNSDTINLSQCINQQNFNAIGAQEAEDRRRQQTRIDNIVGIVLQRVRPMVGAYGPQLTLLQVPNGADVVASIAGYAIRHQAGVHVLSATGWVNTTVLRQSYPPTAMLSVAGPGPLWILSMTGLTMPGRNNTTAMNRVTVFFGENGGQVTGGDVVGALTAVGEVQVFAVTFLQLPVTDTAYLNNNADQGGVGIPPMVPAQQMPPSLSFVSASAVSGGQSGVGIPSMTPAQQMPYGPARNW